MLRAVERQGCYFKKFDLNALADLEMDRYGTLKYQAQAKYLGTYIYLVALLQDIHTLRSTALSIFIFYLFIYIPPSGIFIYTFHVCITCPPLIMFHMYLFSLCLTLSYSSRTRRRSFAQRTICCQQVSYILLSSTVQLSNDILTLSLSVLPQQSKQG